MMKHGNTKSLCEGLVMRLNKNSSNGLLVIGFLAASLPITSNAAIITLTATENSGMLDGSNINNQFPGIIFSELDTQGTGNIWLSLLKFDLSSFSGMTINSASFELTSIFNHNSGAFTHDVFSSSDDGWTEGTVTGANRPLDSTLTILDSISIDASSQTYSWDVLSGVVGTDGLAGSNDFLSLFLRPELSQAGAVIGGFGPHFNDRTATSGFPLLRIDASPTVPPNPNSSVPEPTSIALLVLGLVGLGFSRKMKTV